jgi:cell division protein FtsW
MSAGRGPFDPTATAIIGVVAALMTIGVVMVASATASLDDAFLSGPLWRSTVARQALFAALGFVTMLVFARVGCRPFAWRPSSAWQPAVGLVVLACLCLAIVLVPGVGLERNGARRWLPVGPPACGICFQPSELGKVAMVVALAAFLAHRRLRVRSVATFLPAILVVGALCGLVGLEDFGTSALLAMTGGAMLVVAGCRLPHVVLATVPGLGAAAWLIRAEPYRWERITSFLDIWAQPQGAGYHPIQSLATIASGGWSGRGLGAGIQKYGYLPASHSDFIFAVLCEEAGLLGGLTVLGLFGALLWLGIRTMRRADSAFPRLVAFGVTMVVCLQAVINLAVVAVVAPTKGIALPFVSAGGSGIVFLGLLAGLLAGVASRETSAPPISVASEAPPATGRGVTSRHGGAKLAGGEVC